MSTIVDNLIAYRILTMLVTPFDQTDAFKLGIIDKNGKALKKPSTDHEKDAYNYLTRLVFNMKKTINKIGGEYKLKNLMTALYLIKEQYKYSDSDIIDEAEFVRILNSNIILAEETLLVQKLMEDGVIGSAPTNVSMPADGSPSKVSTDVPIKRKKTSILRRQDLTPIAVDLNQKAL